MSSFVIGFIEDVLIFTTIVKTVCNVTPLSTIYTERQDFAYNLHMKLVTEFSL